MSQEPSYPEETQIFDDSIDEVVPYKYSITSYGADYPVDSLISRLEKDVVFVPHFQRSFVWTLNQASRFIESLLLGLPVPGIFLSKEPDTGKLLIIDGQQRLKTLQYFYQGVFQNNRVFALRNVQSRFEGKTYRKLEEQDKLTLDDSIIHATIIKQDEPSEDQSSIYHIFERLNTGGTLLQPQEIRACIFYGPLNDLLDQLNKDSSWRAIYGNTSKRLKDEELILRFFALFFNFDNYQRPIKEFLNDYMGRNRHFQLQDVETLRSTFLQTICIFAATLAKEAFRPEGVLNAAVFDSVMVGLARRISRGILNNPDQLRQSYNDLLNNKEFFNACKTATSDPANVETRIRLATEYFSSLS